MTLRNVSVLACASLAWLGCDPELNKPERLDSLRVLAVQKSAPYAKPGAEVDFSILWYDGRDAPEPGSDQVDLLWFAGCANPPGDLFYWCYLQLAFAGFLLDSPGFAPGDSFTLSLPSDSDQVGSEPRTVDLVRTGSGTRFRYPVPQDLIAGHPPPDSPELPSYGLTYAFFTACAGEVRLLPEWRTLAEQISELMQGMRGSDEAGAGTDRDPRQALLSLVTQSELPNTFPLGCYARGGTLLGPEHYVAGYSALYAYDEDANSNPPILGVRVGGREFRSADSAGDPLERPGPLCVGASCLEPNPPHQALPDSSSCEDYISCVPICTKAARSECPTYRIQPLLDEADVERTGLTGRSEQMWVRYYVSAGSLEGDTKLVSDAATGWNPDHGSDLVAPQDPGPFFVWAVVHDSRGGVNWVRATLLAEE